MGSRGPSSSTASGSHSKSKPRIVGRYELGRTLGQGSFAKVKLARDVKSMQQVAIKVMEKEKILKHKMADQIKREITVMKMVRHPNVVRLIEVMASQSKVYMVLEFAAGGELFDRIVHRGRLGESEARRYFQQLVDAVDCCHAKGVCHRDLKPENMLVDAHGNLKVSDFGLSALPEQQHRDGLLHTTCGTPNYVAPEVLHDRGYDGRLADVWSCGVILFVLLAGHVPFQDRDLHRLYRKIRSGLFAFPACVSPSARALISAILQPDPAKRLTLAGIRRHAWFQPGYVPALPSPEAPVHTCDIDAVFSNHHLLPAVPQPPPSQLSAGLRITAVESLPRSCSPPLPSPSSDASTAPSSSLLSTGPSCSVLSPRALSRATNSSSGSGLGSGNGGSALTSPRQPPSATAAAAAADVPILTHPSPSCSSCRLETQGSAQSLGERGGDGGEEDMAGEGGVKEGGGEGAVQECPELLNAFDLIARAHALDLGVLFHRRADPVLRPTRFASRLPPALIRSRLLALAPPLQADAHAKHFKIRFSRPATVTGRELSVVVQIFEMTTGLFMVEARKAAGDTLEFHKFYRALLARVSDMVCHDSAATTAHPPVTAHPTTALLAPAPVVASSPPARAIRPSVSPPGKFGKAGVAQGTRDEAPLLEQSQQGQSQPADRRSSLDEGQRTTVNGCGGGDTSRRRSMDETSQPYADMAARAAAAAAAAARRNEAALKSPAKARSLDFWPGSLRSSTLLSPLFKSRSTASPSISLSGPPSPLPPALSLASPHRCSCAGPVCHCGYALSRGLDGSGGSDGEGGGDGETEALGHAAAREMKAGAAVAAATADTAALRGDERGVGWRHTTDSNGHWLLVVK
ncbi:hypothetical protein CLOP_g8482 [Closterium sp. NIES-67]|nr:hypothetical protein CLOP_g8482 [Closterium sp. NIES-67]